MKFDQPTRNYQPVQFQLTKGSWLFRLWGTQGGFLYNNNGGKGAYSEGLFITDYNITLYYHVGKMGSCANTVITTSTFDGGSNFIGRDNDRSCTGGSATFISRDENGEQLLLISGAGGGSGQYAAKNVEFIGGFGGPFAGDGVGQAFQIEESEAIKVRGKGATRIHPGDGGSHPGGTNDKYINRPALGKRGEYLKGGDADTGASGSSGGGGSGYFGGGGGADIGGGGGGSSYASPDLYNVILLGGDKAVDSPSATREVGHSNNGCIEIIKHNPYTIEKNNNSSCNRKIVSIVYYFHYPTYFSILFLGFLFEIK
ncbi:PE-PGRS protein, putative [Trichomonas vaginalis G3]|uniref:receptor protein-tyrosine kinase n=1 Tax=Trichomonas vaginalis (strain ATCC PRA-98 / G3) TaxID=412133 RepID=A2EFT5_TRIV3|nr:glycine-rich protein family [Trichomonas vaginalis G3]EAY08486.1 PE-PGRS protein, putative [Trichomonas vaginalis G3]KAI5537757.1 glycine-rich protein family [Trichomonas vaginalis G3]|eukprot:XP_001320709.1 PE-PGRS protein [Trichomonas vaginalis G3]